jgi:hypothetical protein
MANNPIHKVRMVVSFIQYRGLIDSSKLALLCLYNHINADKALLCYLLNKFIM